MTEMTMQLATTIANAWLNEEPLHEIVLKTKMDHVSVMDALRKMRMPDRHPTTRKLYERGGFVD